MFLFYLGYVYLNTFVRGNNKKIIRTMLNFITNCDFIIKLNDNVIELKRGKKCRTIV